MKGSWTFGQKVGAGFALVVGLTVGVGWIAVRSLQAVVAEKDRVILVNAHNLLDAEKLKSAMEWKVAALRGFLLSKEDIFLERSRQARDAFAATLSRLRNQVDIDESRRLLGEIEKAEADHQDAAEKTVSLRRTETNLDTVERVFEKEIFPRRDVLSGKIDAFVQGEEKRTAEAKSASTAKAEAAIRFMAALVIAAVLAAALIAFVLTRALTRQIGGAVQHVQNSSSELQAAANQQASGAREQATSMNEISTTISELLAASRQIAESAQRVAHIAGETAQAAKSGDLTVQKTQDAIGSIKRQVDLIVTHMLDLGKKSQQIGGILEIINELAEQTNILSINASVEAAGAGEGGKRFAVVADEIRKLADRVGASTKEIRSLIEEIRAAVNTTVMATEGGSKATEAGAKQYAEVATSFQRIAGLVGTSTEAAREIELSTKQQATAVEQVNLAISNVAQATKETEASSSQTLQTATQLTTLSRELARLIQATNGRN